MFEHSVKVPRHFKIAANIFKKVYTEGGSVKTLLYDDKLKHFRTNVLYALITETIKHAVDIDKIFESCGILAKEPRLDPWLAKVLTAELLFGKKSLPGKSKPEQTILSYKEQFEKSLPEQQDVSKSKVVRRPRYVRINTNLLATSDAIRAFQDEGYRFIRCTSGSYNDYLQQIQGLTEYDFTQDYHVKTMFVFAPGTKLHEHDLYLENQIILQDKATALAVHLLAPPAGSVALDMCAAPGMKTTQLAAYLRNQGKVYAIERNEERYQTLCDFVEKTGSKCVETLHKDSLEIKRGDCDDVEYILLDPSCSGSGMDLHVHNYIEETRLARLTSLQEKFLKHAMNSFPNAKRIVYSTCSLFPEENERVITNVVKTSRAKWRVQDVKELLKGQWNNFGSGMYGSMGTRCLYAVPDSDLTTGFFLAVLDRDPKEDKSHGENNSELESNNNKTKQLNIDTVKDNTGTEYKEEDNNEVKHKRKKNKKEHVDDTNNYQIKEANINDNEEVTNNQNNLDEIKQNGHRKKKHSHENNVESNQDTENSEINESGKQKRKKKKKKDDLENLDDADNDFNNTETEVQIEHNVDKTKKNKKRKIRDTIQEENENNDLNHTINTSIAVNDCDNDSSKVEGKKKKKNRKVESDSPDFSQIEKGNKKSRVETVEDSNENSLLNNEEPIKTKKKKKNKHPDLNEAMKINDNIEKSKKKNKTKEISDVSNEEIFTDDGSIKKKKNKSKHADLEILDNNETSEELPKKKKKKIKEI